MKKKGLIIATIVMVLVLAISLTTATYAWFSSTATVSVSNMTLTTNAVAGLELAVYNNSTYYSGELGMSGQYIEGTDEDWGSELSFTSPGASEHATTHLIWTQVGTNSEAAFDTYYTYAANIYTKASANDGTYNSGTTYYTCANDTSSLDSNMYVPTAYDDDTNPISFTKATNLTNYFYLPIRVRSTMQVKQIFYRIKITPSMGTAKTDFYPGMAAASRIQIKKGLSDSLVTENLTPFNAAHISGTAMLDGSDAKYTVTPTPDTYSIDGFILNESTAQAAYTEYEFNFQMWIEGTDLQCVNKTAGSGFTVELVFGYTDASGTAVTLTSGVINYDFKNASGTSISTGTYQE